VQEVCKIPAPLWLHRAGPSVGCLEPSAVKSLAVVLPARAGGSLWWASAPALCGRFWRVRRFFRRWNSGQGVSQLAPPPSHRIIVRTTTVGVAWQAGPGALEAILACIWPLPVAVVYNDKPS